MNEDNPSAANSKSGASKRRKQPFVKVGENVSIYLRGEKWYANYQIDNRQYRKSLGTKSAKEARRRAIVLEADISTGRFNPRTEVATVAEAVVLYKESLHTEKRAPSTIKKYGPILDRMLALTVALKIKTLDRLNLSFVDRYRSLRYKANRSEKTVYNEATIIRQMVNFSLARNLVFHDPLKGLKLKKPKPTPQPCWTFEEVQRILAAAPDDLRPPLTLLAETGMRFGELAWLTWEDIDDDANVLLIQGKDGWKPKSGDGRNIPISPAARVVLDSLPQMGRWVTTMLPSKRYPKRGRQWTERRLLNALQLVLKKLNLPGKIHTFRHFFISNALLKGTPTATVRSWVGHVDDKIIALYTHVDDEASQAAMQRLTTANSNQLQPKESENDRSAMEAGSAQIQHTASQKPKV